MSAIPVDRIVKAIIDADAALQALISGRAYNSVADVKAFPALAFYNVSTTPLKVVNGQTGVWRGLVQISVFADSGASREAVAQAVVDAFRDRRGLLVAGVRVEWTAVDIVHDIPAGDANGRPVRVVEVSVVWRE